MGKVTIDRESLEGFQNGMIEGQGTEIARLEVLDEGKVVTLETNSKGEDTFLEIVEFELDGGRENEVEHSEPIYDIEEEEIEELLKNWMR